MTIDRELKYDEHTTEESTLHGIFRLFIVKTKK